VIAADVDVAVAFVWLSTAAKAAAFVAPVQGIATPPQVLLAPFTVIVPAVPAPPVPMYKSMRVLEPPTFDSTDVHVYGVEKLSVIDEIPPVSQE
jgi:hypothetical protein